MSDDVRGGFRFAAGHPALDLPATLSGRLKDERIERLKNPVDLARWLEAAGLGVDVGGANEAELRHARSLRESLYALALARSLGRPLSADALKILNAAAGVPAATLQLTPDGSLHLRGDVRALLGHIARAGIELLGGDQAGRIRQCEGDVCTLLFIDTSRAGRRRWCSMAGCGNRAKVAEFRSRGRER